jgi:hypothetical protein
VCVRTRCRVRLCMNWPRTSLACLHCCGRAEGILTRQPTRPSGPYRQHPPLAPSSAPDRVARRGPPLWLPSASPPAPACQRAAPVSEPAEPTSLAIPCQGTQVGDAQLRGRRAIALQGHWPRPSVSQGTSQGYHLANTMSSRWQVVQRDTQTAVTLLVSPAGPRIVSPANRYVK